MHRITLAAGESLYCEGDPAADAFLILAGEVAMERNATAITAGKGAVVGLSALINRPYGATARAVHGAVVLSFSRRELRALIRSDPDRAVEIVDAIIELLSKVSEAGQPMAH